MCVICGISFHILDVRLLKKMELAAWVPDVCRTGDGQRQRTNRQQRMIEPNQREKENINMTADLKMDDSNTKSAQ